MPFWLVKPRTSPDTTPVIVNLAPVRCVSSASDRPIDASITAATPFSVYCRVPPAVATGRSFNAVTFTVAVTLPLV